MKFLLFALICVIGATAKAQDRSDWQSLTRLQNGESIRMLLKSGPAVKGAFQSWTQQEVITGRVTAKREDVLTIERYGQSGGGRGKHALVGALIGLGAGFVIGAAAGGCDRGGFGPCITRAGGGAIVGGFGMVLGGGIGALLPARRTRELIYSAK